MTLRYGIIGGGFITGFQLRALASVRGVEVAGFVSRTPPEAHAAFVRQHDLGAGEETRRRDGDEPPAGFRDVAGRPVGRRVGDSHGRLPDQAGFFR